MTFLLGSEVQETQKKGIHCDQDGFYTTSGVCNLGGPVKKVVIVERQNVWEHDLVSKKWNKGGNLAGNESFKKLVLAGPPQSQNRGNQNFGGGV